MTIMITKMHREKNWRCVLFLSLVFFATIDLSSAIRFSTQYPRYWEYMGKPVLLIGGWWGGHNPFLYHSGVKMANGENVSTEKEITDHMDELVAAGGNYLRCVLDPGYGTGRGFAFSSKNSDGKYDLNNMTGPYWNRLEFFISEAQKKRYRSSIRSMG